MMTEIYLLALVTGLGSVWYGFKLSEQVYCIALVFTGAILLVMGLIAAPSLMKIAVLGLLWLCSNNILMTKERF